MRDGVTKGLQFFIRRFQLQRALANTLFQRSVQPENLSFRLLAIRYKWEMPKFVFSEGEKK